MGGPLPKQVQQDSRGCWFTLPAAGMQGYQGRSPWLVGRSGPGEAMRAGLRWGVLRCQPGYERLHLVVLVLGGAASNVKLSVSMLVPILNPMLFPIEISTPDP